MASILCPLLDHSFVDPKKHKDELPVADQVAQAMGIPETIVRMARAFWLHEHGTDFQNATQLFQLAEELIGNPEKQYQAGKLVHAAEQEKKKVMEKEKKLQGEQMKMKNDLDKEKDKKDAEEPSLPGKVDEDGCCLEKSMKQLKLSTAVDDAVRNGDIATAMSEILLKKQKAELADLVVEEEAARNETKVQDKNKEKEKGELRAKVQSLAKENHKLRQRKTCRKCRKVDLASSGVTFLPCGHFITCEACSESFDDCPACGKSIMGTVRTFLS